MLEEFLRLPEVVFRAPDRLWLAAPIALVLLLVPLAARVPARRAALPVAVRALLLLVLLAVILDPAVRTLERRRGRLLVLADVSPSVGAAGLEEQRTFLGAARDPFDLVTFGAQPVLAGTGLVDAKLEADSRERTDLAGALGLATARATAGEPLRVVLLSDGRPTEPGAEEAALRLRRPEVEIWAVGVPAQAGTPRAALRATEIVLPPRDSRTEPFDLRARLVADGRANVEAVLYLDGEERAREGVEVAAGDTEVVFRGLALPPGLYHAQVLLIGDDTPEDNVVATDLLVPGTPRVLLLAAGPRRSLLAEALRTQGMEAEVVVPGADTRLDACDAVVVLQDAEVEGLDAMAAGLADFVGRRGGGLLAVGGSDGPGLARLHGTPTAQLLPVDVPARPAPEPPPPTPEPGTTPRVEIVEEETEAFPITLCLVLDRSGSMHGRKMEQAKAAAAAAAQALTPADRIAVVAFGDEAEVVVPPMPAGEPRTVLAALARLEAASSRTVMFAALDLGYRLLRLERNPIRHLVLICDGQSHDEGPWRGLVTSMAGEKITMSAVGIGFDVDSWMLGRLAQWGAGKYWMANHPYRVPQVVTQDTQRLVEARDRRGKDAERALRPPEEPPPPQPEPREPAPPPPLKMVPIAPEQGVPREMLAGLPDEGLPEVAGVEESKARFSAWVAARAGEDGPPLLAYWRLGLGTVATLLVDPEEPGGDALREHPEFARLVAQLVRSLLPDVSRDPFLVQQEIDRQEHRELLTVRLLAEDGLPRTDLPLELTLAGKPLDVVRRAGTFEALLPLRDQPSTAEVRVDSPSSQPFVRRFVLPPSAPREQVGAGVDRSLLLRLTGRQERLDAPPGAVLAAPESAVVVARPLVLPFLVLGAMLLVLDAWTRRRAASGSR